MSKTKRTNGFHVPRPGVAGPARGQRRVSAVARGLTAVAALSGAACSSSSSEAVRTEDLGRSLSEALTAPTIDPRASIFITDTAIVSRFSLQAVLQQLVTQSLAAGNAGPATPTALFQQMFATEAPPECTSDPTDTAEGQFEGVPFGTVAEAGSLNGWPIQCPREEATEAQNDPFDASADAAPPDNAYMATTLSNRFDLASPDASDCGEYRLNFARVSGADLNSGLRALQRLFIAFEARVPNPNPSLGLQGCLPIEQFWASLSGMDETSRGTALLNFYFKGLPSAGVGPVIDIANYGARTATNGQSSGQVRINQFFFPQSNEFQDWSPREFLLESVKGSSGTQLQFVPSFDKTVPSATLFDPNSTSPLASSFQTTYFPAQIERLALNDPNAMNFATTVPSPFDIPDDQIADPATDYTVSFDGGPSAFTTRIQQQLTAVGSPLTPEQIVARAMSQTCAGCHLKSLAPSSGTATGARDLGGGVSLSTQNLVDTQTQLGFVQVAEDTEAIPDASTPDASRFIAQPVITNVFLPYRKQVMVDFLSSVPGFERGAAWTSSQATVSLAASPVTQGSAALEILPTQGWAEIDSVRFSSVALAPIQKVMVDVFLPTNQPNPTWLGQVTLLMNIPSARVQNVTVGQVPLNGLKTGAYNTISMALPANIQRALTYGVTDIQVGIQLNVNPNASPYYFDNLRFH